MHKKAIFLMGPTASGKTALAIQLALEYPVEIISVDSAMVYRGMDIGTGKPSAAELLLTPHHLIDICDPSMAYSAAQFAADAMVKIEEITNRGKIPLLVGGTMLYFRALLNGLSPLPSANLLIRAEIEAEAKLSSWHALHEQLAKIDPKAGSRIHPNDPQRIQRALEVYRITGRPMSDFYQEPHNNASLISDYEIHQFCLMPEQRSVLHDRIEKRFDQMLAKGLINEVEQLYEHKNLSLDLPALRAVGYRQIILYLEKHYTYEEMRYKGIVATRQLAKRQLTWLRNLSNIQWLNDNKHLDSLKSVIHC
jgi:tRNA dimethylallyltransferase